MRYSCEKRGLAGGKIAKGMKVSKKKKPAVTRRWGIETLIFGFIQVDKGQTSTVKEDNERALPLR